MKFINKVLCITALFTINSVSAKIREANTPATAPARTAPATAPARTAPGRAPARTAPRRGPARNQPAAQVQSYKQLHDNILTKRQAEVFAGNKLNETFIQNTAAQAQAADLGADGLKFLLQTARDKFAPFTGNDANDLTMLMQINGQIDTATQNI